jgi:hypothetical protein
VSTAGETAVRVVIGALALALAPFLLYIGPVVVFRCEPKGAAAFCAIERRLGGLIRIGRIEIAGIRHADGSTSTRRYTAHEPGRPRETYNASSTAASLTLVGTADQILYRETQDNPVGRKSEWIATEIERLAAGERTTAFMVWQVPWIPTLFATFLSLVLGPVLVSVLQVRMRGQAPSDLAPLLTFGLLVPVFAAAWTLALLGRFPEAVARALGALTGL